MRAYFLLLTVVWTNILTERVYLYFFFVKPSNQVTLETVKAFEIEIFVKKIVALICGRKDTFIKLIGFFILQN